MQLYFNSNHQNTPWHPLECTLYYLKWPHQPFVARITTMEFIANLQQHKHEWKPIFVNHKLLFHHKKRKWIEDLQLEIWGKFTL